MKKRSELRIAQTCGLQDDLPKLLCGEIIQLHSTEHWPRQFEDRYGAGVPCMCRIRHAEDLGCTSFRGSVTATKRYSATTEGLVQQLGLRSETGHLLLQPDTGEVSLSPCVSANVSSATVSAMGNAA